MTLYGTPGWRAPRGPSERLSEGPCSGGAERRSIREICIVRCSALYQQRVFCKPHSVLPCWARVSSGQRPLFATSGPSDWSEPRSAISHRGLGPDTSSGPWPPLPPPGILVVGRYIFSVVLISKYCGNEPNTLVWLYPLFNKLQLRFVISNKSAASLGCIARIWLASFTYVSFQLITSFRGYRPISEQMCLHSKWFCKWTLRKCLPNFIIDRLIMSTWFFSNLMSIFI